MSKGKGTLLNLRLYRLAFAPTLAALVVLAFSLDGLPEPVEPGPVTLTFEGGRAAAAARDVVAAGEDRSPGSAGDAAAADYVLERFEALESGTVAEQEFEADIDGNDVALRNVVLTLPGASERTLVVVAGRDSRSGPGFTSSAAATGVLLELAQQLGVADRERTLTLASTDGASAGAEGARELLDALPDPGLVEAVIVVAQPSAAEPEPPHLVLSASGERNPSVELVRIAEQQLEERAQLAAGLESPFGQLARLALPGAAGEQAALGGEGFEALAFSSAGEVPLPPERDDSEALNPSLLSDYGSAILATLGALDAVPAQLATGPDTYLRFSGNIVPGWAVAMIALALLLPPAAVAVAELGRAARHGEGPGRAIRWAVGWLAPVATGLLSVYALGFAGLIPTPPLPYDPGRFAVGPAELLALAAILAAVGAVWWALGLRRVPIAPERATLGAACAAVAVVGGALLWLANPFLVLLLVPTTHVVAVFGLGAGTARGAVVPAALLALIPFAAALAHVAGQLEWGTSLPWQLVLLTSGGGAGPLETAAALAVLAALAALVWATLVPERRRGANRVVQGGGAAVDTPARH